MKVNREELRKEIENIISDGVFNGEEVDLTTQNIIEVIELLIRAAENNNQSERRWRRMKIEEATYTTEMVERRKQLTPDVYGCDECGSVMDELPNEPNRLEMRVFHHTQEDTDSLHFCSWRCVLKHIPKIQSDYFVDMPFLYFDSKEGDKRLASELVEIIKSMNL